MGKIDLETNQRDIIFYREIGTEGMNVYNQHLIKSLLQGTTVLVYAFDLLKAETLLKVREWFEYLNGLNITKPQAQNINSYPKAILLGSKHDLFVVEPFEKKEEILNQAKKISIEINAPLHLFSPYNVIPNHANSMLPAPNKEIYEVIIDMCLEYASSSHTNTLYNDNNNNSLTTSLNNSHHHPSSNEQAGS